MVKTAPSSALETRRGSSSVDLLAQTSLVGKPKTARPFSATVKSFNFTHVRPRLIEQGLHDNPTFLGLSDGFKRLFSADRSDRKMVIPVSGYGGHRRGDRS